MNFSVAIGILVAQRRKKTVEELVIWCASPDPDIAWVIDVRSLVKNVVHRVFIKNILGESAIILENFFLVPVGHSVAGRQHLGIFDNHFDDMLVAMMSNAVLDVPREEEDIHDAVTTHLFLSLLFD